MNEMQSWQSAPLVNLDRQGRAIVRHANHAVLAEQAKAVESAVVIQNTTALADGLMTSLDRLRRHEARAAADDPMVADEYARIRRLVADLGLNEIQRYGQRPWV
jgi:hypothetical protein